MFGRRRRQPETESAFDKKTIPGVPDVFTGQDTTIGTMRKMARQVRDSSSVTEMECGLAISLLAVIDMLEKASEEQAVQQA